MQALPHQTNAPAEMRQWHQAVALFIVLLMTIGNLVVYPLARQKSPSRISHELQDDTASRRPVTKLPEILSRTFCALWCGVMVGQLALAAVWLGVGPPGALVRIVSAAGVYFILGCALMIALIWREYTIVEDFHNYHRAAEYSVPLFIFGVPVFILTVAAPLWLLRFLRGWHIRHESIVAPLRVHQFSIGDLMVVTTLIAVLLGGVLVCFRVEMVPLEVWQVLGGCWVASFILGAAALTPAVLLLSRYPLRAFAALIGVAVGIHSLTVWLILAFPRAFGVTQTSVHTGPTLGVAAGVLLGFLVTVCLALVVVRRCGYRLLMGASAKY